MSRFRALTPLTPLMLVALTLLVPSFMGCAADTATAGQEAESSDEIRSTLLGNVGAIRINGGAPVAAPSKVQRILKDDDTKVVGISNLSSAKLEKGNHFLLYGISLLAGVAGQGESAGSVNFAVIPDYLRNGEFEFMANSTSLIPNASCEVFNTTGQTIPTGFYELHNPKLVRDQQAMEFNLEWATNAPENTYIKAILHGTMITKA